MTRKTRTGNRITAMLAVGLATAALAAPSALADGRSPDTLDAAVAAQAAGLDGRSADTLDAAGVQIAPLDGRSADTLDASYAAQATSLDGRSADTLDAAGVQAAPLDGRSPDTVDSTVVAHEPVVVVNATGFDWADAGIGFGAALGLALLSLAGAVGIRRLGVSATRIPA